MDWFATQLLNWHADQGRTDLPWQQDINPYRVWISEIMLQQTQVSTVIDYYNRFMQRFPSVDNLAAAELDEVLHLWTGLGYYARARNLHKTAVIVSEEYGGHFPDDQEKLEALPGIGRSTAGAIRSIAMSAHATILDGNVKRVLCRFHTVSGYPGTTKGSQALWQLAESHTPTTQTGVYTQAIMDLGATLCTRRNPDCTRCPVQKKCLAFKNSTQHEFPARKPKKDKPIRAARFFVISLKNGSTLLEQKPLEGLWGGLWTPLERSDHTETTQVLDEVDLGGAIIERVHTAPVFRHTFTHFHLDIEPIYIHLNDAPISVAEQNNLQWVQPSMLDRANNPIGLSAPAVRLLKSLQEFSL